MFGKKKTAEKIEGSDPISQVKRAKRDVGRKIRLGCILLILFSGVLCFGGTLFLWFGGYVQDWTCNIVTEDSDIADQFDCKKTEEVGDEDADFKYNVIDKEDKEIVVSDIETIVTDVVENATPAVVGIGILGDTASQDQIIGTGFIVSENGLIVTNQHVVSAAQEEDFFVVVNGVEKPYSVEKIYRDSVNDLALVKIDAKGLKTLPLGDSTDLKVGQTVIAIGNPLGDLTGTVTTGIISALDRDVKVGSGFFQTQVETFEDVIQTDAAVNPGNSGGPLINSNGEVIGVNFATIQGADNLSFAIPIDRVKKRIDELNKFGAFKIPYLGVDYRKRVIFVENESVVGALVIAVAPASPAEQAGIKKGDIIVQFDGQTLDEINLFTLIQKTEVGKEVEIVLLRDNKQMTVKAKVGERG